MLLVHGALLHRAEKRRPSAPSMTKQEERDSLAERYTMLQRSLGQTQEDEEKLDAAGAQLRKQVCATDVLWSILENTHDLDSCRQASGRLSIPWWLSTTA